MLRIRLQKVGKRNQPFFRFVVTDKRNATQSGKFLEVLGDFNPNNNLRKIDVQRVKHWISFGAKPTDTVHNILVSDKIIDGKKINVLPKKNPISKEKTDDETKASVNKVKSENMSVPTVAKEDDQKVSEKEVVDATSKKEGETKPDNTDTSGVAEPQIEIKS